jgi:methionyl-tRNA synthetase
MSKNILVTTALVYANGPLHLGHLVEQVQADIWVRNQKLKGNNCIFIGGDDAHGTPIMLGAKQQNIDPEEMVAKIFSEHTARSKSFLIAYDYYGSTREDNHHAVVTKCYSAMQQKNLITTKEIAQAYDTSAKMFLPDRFVTGTCPKCKQPEQYGDSCDACGGIYDPLELINPISKISGTTPIEKQSDHYFFELKQLQNELKSWIQNSNLQEPVKNKLLEWFNNDLKAWDISRDEPYFGLQIPGTTNKYFYVWLDAPIGYISMTQKFREQTPNNCIDFWSKDTDAEIHQFIGKDISYFHGIFWPAILNTAEYKLPNTIHAHGFLTINGKKMSKSKGTFITAAEYLDKLNPEYFRYYLATRLADSIEDIDLNWEEFMNKVNSDLIGKVINIASRCSGFIQNKFNGKLAGSTDNIDLINIILSEKDNIINYYEQKKFSAATTKIIQLADLANQYIAKEEPWLKIKDPAQHEHVHQVCTTAINIFRIIMAYLTPILPHTSAESMDFLNCSLADWACLDELLLGHDIKPYKHLLQRVTEADIPK